MLLGAAAAIFTGVKTYAARACQHALPLYQRHRLETFRQLGNVLDASSFASFGEQHEACTVEGSCFDAAVRVGGKGKR